jgi:hypothetical protein
MLPEPVRVYVRVLVAEIRPVAVRTTWKLPVAPERMPVPPVMVPAAFSTGNVPGSPTVDALMIVPFASVNVMAVADGFNSAVHVPNGGSVPVKFVGAYVNDPAGAPGVCTPTATAVKFKLKETVPAKAGETLTIPARIPTVARRTLLGMQAVYQSAAT